MLHSKLIEALSKALKQGYLLVALPEVGCQTRGTNGDSECQFGKNMKKGTVYSHSIPCNCSVIFFDKPLITFDNKVYSEVVVFYFKNEKSMFFQ
jgi:hypothetical protein